MEIGILCSLLEAKAWTFVLTSLLISLKFVKKFKAAFMLSAFEWSIGSELREETS